MRKRTPDEVKLQSEEDAQLGYCTAALNDVVLTGQERLQVHLDLMNGVGDIVTIEDVDDMGGSVRLPVLLVKCVFICFSVGCTLE